MKTKFFDGCSSLEDVKKRYRDLAKQHHPDKGGDLETMKKLNAEYDYIINSGRFEFKTEQEKEETILYKDLIAKLIVLDGLVIEIVFRWIWLSGNTKVHKEIIKQLGFKFSGDKKMWYWHPAGWEKTFNRSKPLSIDEIRARYGSKTFEGQKEKETKNDTKQKKQNKLQSV